MSRTVFISAGESSGDQHAGAVARELRRRDPSLRLVGLGGRRMAEQGVELLEDLDRLAVMGFAEVVRSVPFFLGLRRRVSRFLEEEPVHLVLPVDYPGFNLWLAGRARKEGIPVLYFIAPQVWAWRESRARRMAETCDRVCVVLPFEEALLARHGVDARFVGHPLLDEAGGEPGGRERSSGDPSGSDRGPILALYPGSRVQEVERILPRFADAARLLLSEGAVADVVLGRTPELAPERFDAAAEFEALPPEEGARRADAALTKSGTITLQLALAGVPMAVGYRVHPLTWRIARRLVAVEHVALVNLVAGERLVPELLQDEMTPDRLADAVRPLLIAGDPVRQRVLRGLSRVRERLGEPGCAARVAGEALSLLERTEDGRGRRMSGGAS